MKSKSKIENRNKIDINNRIFHAETEHKTIICVSHGESLSQAFPQWLRCAYLGPSAGLPYRPYDLNMPLTILRRPRSAHAVDSHLTEFGKVTAAIIASDICKAELLPKQVFCSSELRSVETALAMVKKFSTNERIIPINVEPALCEWRNFDEVGTEKHWLTVEQLKKFGYPVNIDYKPLITIEYLAISETPFQYFERLFECMQHVVQNFEGPSIIIGSSGLISLSKGIGWKTGKDLEKIRATTENCATNVLCKLGFKHKKVGPVRIIHKVLPFTRSYNEAKMKRGEM